MIPTKFTIVVLDFNFVTLDMDNMKIHLVFGHKTLTCVVPYNTRSPTVMSGFVTGC